MAVFRCQKDCHQAVLSLLYRAEVSADHAPIAAEPSTGQAPASADVAPTSAGTPPTALRC